MNRTQFEHAFFALLIQLALSPVVGMDGGGVAAVFGMFMREFAQVEYQLRAKSGMTLTQIMPWHVLKPRLWSLDGMLDWLVPALFCYIAFIVSGVHP